MPVRLANGLLLAALLVLLSGPCGYLIASAPATWTEVGDGVSWYATTLWKQRLLLLPMVGLGAMVWLAWLALALRNRARFRAEAAARAATTRQPSRESRVRRARRRIDLGAKRARHKPEAVLEALLGAMLDLDATELRLEHGDLLVDVNLMVEDKARHVASLTGDHFQALLDQVARVSQVGEGQEGELELRSRAGGERIGVTRSEGPLGPVLRLRTLAPGQGPSAHGGRRRPSMVIQLDSGAPVRRPTGELAGPSYLGPDDTTDSGSGLLIGLDPSAETEIAPMLDTPEPRPVRGVEAWLRLASSLVLLFLLGLMIVPTQVWAMRRLLRGEITAPWREIYVLVQSTPTGAKVVVAGEPHGRTPLVFREPCGGRPLQVIVEAPRYAVWQWTGICPRRGQLKLEAELQPLQR